MTFSRRESVLFFSRFLSFFSGDTIVGSVSNPANARDLSSPLILESIQCLRSLSASVTTSAVSVLGWSRLSQIGGGQFQLDAADSITQDNGGTVIVDQAGRRWKRVLPDDYFLTPQMFGAMGDGAADDTTGLQRAIDCVVLNGGKLLIPGGRYRVTSPLAVGDSGTAYRSGFTIEGVARSTPSLNGGTLILLDAIGAPAVLIWKRTAWRNGNLRNIGLASLVADGANYGLLIQSSEISDIHFDSLRIENVTTAIGLHQGSGSNGEFCSFTNVSTRDVLNFFHSSAGQAFGIDFNHVFCYHRGGGTLFLMDPETVGGGLVVRAFNATPTDPKKRASVTNTTLLRLGNKHNAPILFEGGRIEHLTCVLSVDQTAQSGILNTPIKFVGMQFTIDNIEDDINNITKYSILLERTPPNLITFDSCQFYAFKSVKTSFVIKAGEGMRGTLRFMMCDFNRFSRLPAVEIGFNTIQEIQFESCVGNPVSTDGSMSAIGLPVKFNRRFGGGGADHQVLAQLPASADLQSGIPINYLLVPQFRIAIGSKNNIGCDAPWRHFGEKLTLAAIRDWSDNGRKVGSGPQSPSPFAKYIIIFPKSGIFQDVTKISLANASTSVAGVGLSFVSYQALLNRIGGQCRIRFSLENSVTKQVYDEVVFNGPGVSRVPQIVALLALIQRTEVGSLRLKIENEGPGKASLDFAHQYVADTTQATFPGGLETNFKNGTIWSANVENGRFYSRLSLPYKSDLYGRKAGPAFDSVTSDIYLSTDSERLVYFANGEWWDVQRVTYANNVPSSGTWSMGDVIYNSTPRPGGHIGWICVAGGAPGVWKLFGAIEH